jgi:hypothetical protein
LEKIPSLIVPHPIPQGLSVSFEVFNAINRRFRFEEPIVHKKNVEV